MGRRGGATCDGVFEADLDFLAFFPPSCFSDGRFGRGSYAYVGFCWRI